MGDMELGKRGGRVIGATDIMRISSPINTDTQHMYDLYFYLIRDMLGVTRDSA
jgi:hypothetical protein